MKTENVFSMTKEYFETAFKNFELFQSQNEKMLKLFLDQMKKENHKLDNTLNDWISDTRKAYKDYRELIIKGLDYLSENLEKQSAPEKKAV